MDLIIVESPTKEKTISKFLEKDISLSSRFIIKSSYGHVRDLPKTVLGVDEDNDFKPTYVIISKAKKNIEELKKVVKQVEYIYLATDFDREGESIAWHLVSVLNLDIKNTKRITFHEITPQAFKDSLKNPRKIDMNLVNAQQARRIIDRLVGYKISPLLWKKIANKLSAGRVQSAALKFINDRELEIQRFVPEEFWSIEAEFLTSKNELLKTKLKEIDGKKIDKLEIKTKIEADEIVNKVKNIGYGNVISIKKEKKKKVPPPPYVTSTLQQEASYKLRFSPSKTMFIAQNLYEGVKLKGEEQVGLITYMRTDSVYVSDYAIEELREFIKKTYTEKYLSNEVRKYKTKIKNAQEAHEAIRPTSVYRTPNSIKEFLTEDQYKLYKLIWERFIVSQFKEVEYEQTIISIDVGDKYKFESEGKRIIFDGFYLIYKDDKDECILADVLQSEKLTVKDCISKQHFTEPPARYSEASLIKELEKHGIGRPSTYANIVDTLKVRGYVKLKDRKFEITPLGKQVIELLDNYFKEIVDKSYTAKVEKMLDEISNGKKEWTEVIKEFYKPLVIDLNKAFSEIKKDPPVVTDIKCSQCGAKMVIRNSRFGKFLSCEKYPKCKNKMNYEPEKISKETN